MVSRWLIQSLCWSGVIVCQSSISFDRSQVNQHLAFFLGVEVVADVSVGNEAFILSSCLGCGP